MKIKKTREPNMSSKVTTIGYELFKVLNVKFLLILATRSRHLSTEINLSRLPKYFKLIDIPMKNINNSL